MSTGESTDAETTEATETTLATLMPRVMSRSVRRARIVMSTEAMRMSEASSRQRARVP